MKNEQEPTIEAVKSNTHESVESHPAYGQVCLFSNSATPGAVLYGSDFRHHRYVTISILKGHLKRGLSHDWPAHDEELIEISMSQSQFARFVSSEGDGGGTQCTIRSFNGKRIPAIAKPTDRTEQFNSEVEMKLKVVMETIEKLSSQITDTKLSQKAKDELQSTLNNIRQNLSCNLDFLAKTFSEHVENTKEQAMTEIHAYMQSAIERSGKAIDGIKMPLAIEEEKK